MSAHGNAITKESARAASSKTGMSKKAIAAPVLEVHTDVTLKACSRCKQAMPLNAETFARDKSSKDGLYGQCKQCEADYRAAKKAASALPVAAMPQAATPPPDKKVKRKK